MSHFSFNKLDGLQYFTGLKELCVVTQEIPVIEGLSQCPFLEALWVADCKVDQIKGLEKNIRLKKLYLYSNHISKIENIAHLTKLEVLWLGDNSIHTPAYCTEYTLREERYYSIGGVGNIGKSAFIMDTGQQNSHNWASTR